MCVSALCVSAVAFGAADVPTITSRIEPDSIMIGDRFTYIIDIEKDMVQEIAFPEFETDPKGSIELVESHPVDTISREGRRLHLRKRYTMAAFEEGRIAMGAAKVLYADKNIVDTLYARDSVYLKIATYQIDSTSQSIYDLKPQYTLRFRVAEIKGYLMWGVLLFLLLGAGLIALIRYLDQRGKRLGDLFRPAPPEPPHVVAIRALEALHHQKLWQNDRHKLYYSLLTDILRTYIAGRWGVSAMEMTTDEIIEAMRTLDLPEKARMDLTSILRDGDLVKFAKFTPEADQNEGDYTRAYYFVEETKPVEIQPDEEDNENE